MKELLLNTIKSDHYEEILRNNGIDCATENFRFHPIDNNTIVKGSFRIRTRAIGADNISIYKTQLSGH